jgi:nucleotide-binding universal stress UspA family protein
MFERMLVASELSQAAFNALKCLKSLQKLGAKECLLVQCFNPYKINPQASSLFASVFAEILNEQKALLTNQGYEVETRVVSGLVKSEINRIAVEEDFPVIVAGVAEHSMITEAFSGGVAQEVIHYAGKPVLLIKTSDNPDLVQGGTGEYDLTRHILFPTDFSDNADSAFDYVKEMVEKGAKKVTIMHVQDQTLIGQYLSHRLPEFKETDLKSLQEIKNELENKGDAEVDIRLVYGSPTAEIIKFVREEKIPLVVMGSQGRGFIKELYLGSVSHNIVRHSAASVLLIPAKR